MFTGLVQSVAPVLSIAQRRLVVERPRSWTGEDRLCPGESIAVNGCCLTAVPDSDELAFDLSAETLTRTTLGSLSAGERVNLERATRPMDRLGGHLVQGHVDGAGLVRAIYEEGNSRVLRIAVPEGSGRYLIDKGSVGLDGVSLTVVRPHGDEFEVWLVPHTLAETNLGDRSPGDQVNLEFDMIAKYVERFVGAWQDRIR
ncbi:MAG TPA: riboflavin synthase [Fimbriimonadaceae bacterium]|nr:riboflavin synthase [Fimbriimonadaceae bacterium]HRJ95565.1 riboflavin synthase [Fimbriimonadaceae bacterium]